jgi:DNA-binding GntR family transcriptional regulator
MGSHVFEQVPHRSLREAALSAIRQAILRGDLAPGQRLVESDIAEQLGVSRAPVREALRQLETEGLVVSAPLRAALESLAVRIVTEKASAETLAQLRQAVADMAGAAREGDLARLAALDMSFHEMLCRAAGHSRLLDIWLSMTAQIRAFIDLTNTLYLPADEVVRLHAEVVEHMEDGRAGEAERALARHILEVGERICRGQNETPDVSGSE